ncbi:phosphoribulokinase [Thermodesulfovibrio sp.]|uniref:phosphoribulokinase n=1 Tax=Thermodesulfovibrio sp. TaxID=2067987 RepID=UPI003C7BE184
MKPVLVGIAGDSGSGKSTFVKTLANLLGEKEVREICFDDYHSLDREERKAVKITPLHPRANNLGLAIEHMWHLKQGKKILKPVYDHSTGKFGEPEWVFPVLYIICEGLHTFYFSVLAVIYDLKIYYDTDLELKIIWKIQRDVVERGYFAEKVIEEIRERQKDIRNFVEPQSQYADILIKLKLHSNNSIAVQWNDSIDAQWFKKILNDPDSWNAVTEWYGGKKWNVYEIARPFTIDEAKKIFKIDSSFKIKEKELEPYMLAAVLVASILKQIRNLKNEKEV